MEIVVDTRKPPTAALYGQLAQLAYLAGQTRKGDLSSQEGHRARAEGPERSTLKQPLDQLQGPGGTQAAPAARRAPAPTVTTTPERPARPDAILRRSLGPL